MFKQISVYIYIYRCKKYVCMKSAGVYIASEWEKSPYMRFSCLYMISALILIKGNAKSTFC